MKHKILLPLFLLIECGLWIAIQHIGGRLNAILSFGSILLALVMVTLRYAKTAEWRLTALALALTVCADFCLVLCQPMQQLGGMLFFVCVQACYFCRIHMLLEGKTRLASLLSHIVLSLLGILLPILVLGKGADLVAIAAIVYILNLLANIVFAYLAGDKTSRLLPIGLTLFILCDIFVGFAMMEGYLPIPEGSSLHFLAYPPFNAAWLFYVPAQALLAISTRLPQKSA